MIVYSSRYRCSTSPLRHLRAPVILCAAASVIGSLLLVSPEPFGGDSAAAGRRGGDISSSVSDPRRLAAPPTPPTAYRLPKRAIWVSNSRQLRRALARRTSTDIVLRAGFYGGSQPFANPGGDRLYAQALGKVVLGVGISMGGTWGPGGGVVQGITFDVSDPSRTLQNSVIHVWGSGRYTRILDVVLKGHGAVGAGILAREVEGLVVRRVVARDFQNWGVAADENTRDPLISHPPVMTDVDVAYVGRPVPKSSNGTAEACVWIGNTAVVRRVRAQDCAWEGLWVGTAADHALFEDIRVTNIDIGVYVEHFARSSTFRRLQIGPGIKQGVICEWANPDWASEPACVDNTIEQSTFDTSVVGVYLDEGTTRTTVRDSTFVGQCWSAIGNYKGVGNLYDTGGNDYLRIQPGAMQISTDHYLAIACARPLPA